MVFYMFDDFIKEIQRIFIADNNWKYMFDGLLNTLLIAFLAVIIGTVLGFVVGMVRATYEKNNGRASNNAFLNFLFKAANWFCKLYLTIIRGTPAMVQLLIIYFVVFASINVEPIIAAVIAPSFFLLERMSSRLAESSSSLRSRLSILLLICLRSLSSLDSPGPLVPIPPPSLDISIPFPTSLGAVYLS